MAGVLICYHCDKTNLMLHLQIDANQQTCFAISVLGGSRQDESGLELCRANFNRGYVELILFQVGQDNFIQRNLNHLETKWDQCPPPHHCEQ